MLSLGQVYHENIIQLQLSRPFSEINEERFHSLEHDEVLRVNWVQYAEIQLQLYSRSGRMYLELNIPAGNIID